MSQDQLAAIIGDAFERRGAPDEIDARLSSRPIRDKLPACPIAPGADPISAKHCRAWRMRGS
jgi:hypothetical protein